MCTSSAVQRIKMPPSLARPGDGQDEWGNDGDGKRKIITKTETLTGIWFQYVLVDFWLTHMRNFGIPFVRLLAPLNTKKERTNAKLAEKQCLYAKSLYTKK